MVERKTDERPKEAWSAYVYFKFMYIHKFNDMEAQFEITARPIFYSNWYKETNGELIMTQYFL